MRGGLQLAIVVVATFGVTRLLDHLLAPAEQLPWRVPDRVRAVKAPCPSSAPTPTSLPPPPPLAEGTAAAAASPPREAARRRTPYLAVIGFPVGIDSRNKDRRDLFRELWYPEYDNLGPAGTVSCEFIIGLLTYQGDGHDAVTQQQLHDEHVEWGDLALVNAREATRDPYRGDPKCTGEKIVAWFQQVVVVHRGTRFFIKADWDTWVHTTRLEVNLRLLLSSRTGPLYFGNTLWCSYSLGDYQPCGYGFGPLQAAGSKQPECSQLPHGNTAIGPFPYAAGLFWGMSYELIEWIAGSRLVYDFVHNASARFEPPYWVKGEDSAFGFFAHISPFPVTPIHWGWNTVHDGYEFRSTAERGLCTQHISETTLAVHSMHTRGDFELVIKQLRERCNATCQQAKLPFTVDGLADLCSRNPKIPQVYSKCASVSGGKKADDGSARHLPKPMPRRRCRSQGANVPFIAAKSQGGTIECTDEPAESQRG